MIEQYASRRNIILRGDKIDSEILNKLFLENKPIPQNYQDRLNHLEELRQRIWKEKGYELIDGKWKKIKT